METEEALAARLRGIRAGTRDAEMLLLAFRWLSANARHPERRFWGPDSREWEREREWAGGEMLEWLEGMLA